jgi:hypothetical protein
MSSRIDSYAQGITAERDSVRFDTLRAVVATMRRNMSMTPGATENEVRKILTQNLPFDETSARIHALRLQDNAVILERLALVADAEPDRVALLLPASVAFCQCPWTCPHYKRECWIRADCCGGKYVACRNCHDEAADHRLDRFAVTHVACRSCGATNVPIGKCCSMCQAEFSRYFCSRCNLLEDDELKAADIYHCDRCGICRRGKGIGIDNHHCERCDCCVPLDVKDSHPCRIGALDVDCPVCKDRLADSIDQVVFMRCGHAIHSACFTKYTETKYTCPICCRSLTDMSRWYKELDAQLDLEGPLPSILASRRSEVFCNDCSMKSVVPWHFQYHKCKPCGSYNTVVLATFPVSLE